jgi:hypothetical protein
MMSGAMVTEASSACLLHESMISSINGVMDIAAPTPKE